MEEKTNSSLSCNVFQPFKYKFPHFNCVDFFPQILSTVRPVLETTCIKQPTVLKEHWSDTTLLESV